VDQLIDQGNSFSGREPNCAFLNLGDGTFATVAALSGFDFPDDARSLALTDWDGDGDLDAWISNRTAPMLRFLRNDTRGGESLRLFLEGTSCVRDAAGARVEVRLKGQLDRPIVRTVKFGEGYLGQSSRWLHFGLGKGAEIASVKIIWPGGKIEEIPNLRPGSSVRIKQGAAPKIEACSTTAAPEEPAPLSPRSAALAGGVTLFQPVLFPPLPSQTPEGKPWQVEPANAPLLVNVFASWCPDCAKELAAWRDAAGQIQSAGLKIALLSADGRDTAHQTTPDGAWAWLKKERIPFAAGVLTDEAFRRLTIQHRLLFGAVVSLPIPTSFLIDAQGRLTAIYRGPVSIDRVLRDAKLDDAARSAAALPYSGTWITPPDPPDPAYWVNDFGALKLWPDAAAFFLRHQKTILPHKNYTAMAGALAAKLAESGDFAAAIQLNEAALTKNEDPAVLNNLASLLANAPDPARRDPARAVKLAQRAVTLTGGKFPALLETLAAAQAAAGDFPAAAVTAENALSLAKSSGDAGLAASLEKNLAAYRAGHLPN
jgi:peroxiredoxin